MRAEDVDGVAPGEEERLDAGLAVRRLAVAGCPGEGQPRGAGRAEGGGHLGALLGVLAVAAAEAGRGGAAGAERRDHLLGRAALSALDLDPAGPEEVGREAGAGGVAAQRADVGQEHPGRAPGGPGERRGPVGERLERGRPDAAAADPPGAVATWTGQGRACAATASRRCRGNSLTPVTGSTRCATRSCRVAAVAASSSATSPERSAAPSPPSRSIRLEPLPRGAREVLGERLDVPGATGRVGHPRDVGLLGQQGVGVAGDPAREGGRQPDRRRRTAGR